MTVHQTKISTKHCHALILSCLKSTFLNIMNIDIFTILIKFYQILNQQKLNISDSETLPVQPAIKKYSLAILFAL